jgi:hypothetical protein
MDIVNFPGMIANGQVTTDPNKIDPSKDLIVVGKKVSKSREGNQYQEIAVPIDTLMGVAKRPYKVYTALLTQSGTDDPTAIVLENTIGDIVWTYSSLGEYLGTLANVFTEDKTYVYAYILPSSLTRFQRDNENRVSIGTTTNLGAKTNGLLNKTSIEIRVYN